VKIYTKTGDEGETGLFGGGRVPKDHRRVEAYGAVDEANAVIGTALAHLHDVELGEMLTTIQADLFTVGAVLATDPQSASAKAITSVSDQDVARLEEWIDAADGALPALRTFILPGGCPAAAALHHARTVVRRAERRATGVVRDGEIDPSVLRYLNRLSDLLFVLARVANRREGVADTPWSAPPPSVP
jgi:cob(I)alamin adenosyltransferase